MRRLLLAAMLLALPLVASASPILYAGTTTVTGSPDISLLPIGTLGTVRVSVNDTPLFIGPQPGQAIYQLGMSLTVLDRQYVTSGWVEVHCFADLISSACALQTLGSSTVVFRNWVGPNVGDYTVFSIGPPAFGSGGGTLDLTSAALGQNMFLPIDIQFHNFTTNADAFLHTGGAFVTVTPEPASIVLLGTGILALARRRRAHR